MLDTKHMNGGWLRFTNAPSATLLPPEGTKGRLLTFFFRCDVNAIQMEHFTTQRTITAYNLSDLAGRLLSCRLLNKRWLWASFSASRQIIQKMRKNKKRLKRGMFNDNVPWFENIKLPSTILNVTNYRSFVYEVVRCWQSSPCYFVMWFNLHKKPAVPELMYIQARVWISFIISRISL